MFNLFCDKMIQLQKILFYLPVIFILGSAQNDSFYFPEESSYLLNSPSVTGNRAEIPQNAPNQNYLEVREKNRYEVYVDSVISSGIARLTLAINRALLNEGGNKNTNVVFAPMSIGGALALVLLGSNGKTFAEITTVLGLTTGVDVKQRSEQVHEQFGRVIAKLEATAGFEIGQEVSFAHAVFVQNNYPIRELYRRTAEDIYQSDILNVDFRGDPNRSQQIINGWVREKTKGKITDILADVPSSVTKVIIASAMYFKALWEKPFFEGTTTRRPFFSNGRHSPTSIEAEMMANGGTFPYFNDPLLRCEVLGLPYKGNATTMYVVMPYASDVEKLKQLEKTITAKDLEALADNTIPTKAVVLFPKMKIESTINLKAPLEELGLRSLFNPSEANLALLSPGEGNVEPANSFNSRTRISSRVTGSKKDTLDTLRQLINQQSSDNSYQNPGLYADKVIHKVYMDITETGTEAAASTSISLSRDGGRVTFRVDVPFFFFIRHEETKTILFWGSVYAPTPNFSRG